MEELDVLWMAALAGLPMAGAICVGLAPRRWPDLGAWSTVLVTAVTLSLAIAILILFRFDTLEQLGALNDVEFRFKGSLDYRSLAADRAPDPAVEKSSDWVGRTAWMNRFGLEWLWGMDGVGMACALAVAACGLSVAAVVRRPSGNPSAWRATLLGLEGVLLAACTQQNLLFLALLMVLAVLLAALLHRFSQVPMPAGTPLPFASVDPAMGIQVARPGFVAAGLTLLAALMLAGQDCHDFAGPDRLEHAAWEAVRSTPGATYEKEYSESAFHTFDLAILARQARAAWHGSDLEGLTLERLRGRVATGKLENGYDTGALLALEESGFINRLAAWSDSRAVVWAGWILAAAAIAWLIAAVGYSVGSGVDRGGDGAGGMARGMLATLYVILLVRVIFPIFPAAFAPGDGHPGLAVLAGILLMVDALFRLWSTRAPRSISILSAWCMGWVSWLGVFAWPAGNQPEDLALGLNGALLAGVCIPLGLALSRGMMLAWPGGGFPVSLALLLQAGAPLGLGALAVLPVAQSLLRGSIWVGSIFILGYAVWLYLVASRSGLWGAAVVSRDPLKPRQILLAWLLPVPLVLTGVVPYLVTAWTEPAATGQADLLLRMPALAPGQGMVVGGGR